MQAVSSQQQTRTAPAHESYMQLVWQRFRKSRVAIVGAVMVSVLVILAVFYEFFSPVDPSKSRMTDSYIPPQRIHFIDLGGRFHLRPFVYTQIVDLDPVTYVPYWTEDVSTPHPIYFFVRSWPYKLLGFIPCDWHLFGTASGEPIRLLGTDRFGRDLWGRTIFAGRISLSLSLLAALIAVGIGSIVGMISGYYGGWFDMVIQRIVEIFQSFPELPLWLALAAIIPKTWSSLQIFFVMSLIFPLIRWTILAREVRGKVLSLREADYITAAKEIGASDRRIIFKHLYPNALSHIIVILTLMVPDVILAEAFLSFLGIGIQEPLSSWGFLMKNAQNLETLGTNTWILTPVFFIMVAVLGLNFLGDGLRDAVDPYANT